jgi:dephospho-CoA kinase
LNSAELCKKWGIGLTGGIACGKSTVASLLKGKGFPVIDADQLSRDAVAPNTRGLAKIVEVYGGSVLSENGTLNRKALGDIVFSDPTKRKELEKILHPIVRDLLTQRLQQLGLFDQPRFWFYEASLLFEVQRDQDFRQVWVVYCPESVQVQRLKQRDGRDRVIADRIIASQLPAKEKAERGDLVIDTSSPIEELDAKIRHALNQLPGRSGIAKLGFGGDQSKG